MLNREELHASVGAVAEVNTVGAEFLAGGLRTVASAPGTCSFGGTSTIEHASRLGSEIEKGKRSAFLSILSAVFANDHVVTVGKRNHVFGVLPAAQWMSIPDRIARFDGLDRGERPRRGDEEDEEDEDDGENEEGKPSLHVAALSAAWSSAWRPWVVDGPTALVARFIIGPVKTVSSCLGMNKTVAAERYGRTDTWVLIGGYGSGTPERRVMESLQPVSKTL